MAVNSACILIKCYEYVIFIYDFNVCFWIFAVASGQEIVSVNQNYYT